MEQEQPFGSSLKVRYIFPDDNESKREIRKMLCPRLPRRAKKQAMNRVLRDRKLCNHIRELYRLNNRQIAYQLTYGTVCSQMFPCHWKDDGSEYIYVSMTTAQHHAAELCFRRILRGK